MSEPSFLLLHGWQNHRPAEHWQHWLADRLSEHGYLVGYPQLPSPDRPELDQWLAELRSQLCALPGRPLTVICHSLSCLLWLHAAAREAVDVPVDRVLLVAPPAPRFVVNEPELAGFAVPEVTAAALSAIAGQTSVLAADDDPYCPDGAAVHYGEPFGLPTELLRGGAHLDLAAGYGPWPAILDWCRDADQQRHGIHPR